MSDFFAHLFDSTGFVRRQDTAGWTRELVWLHTGGDILIALACLLMPAAVCYFARGRLGGRVPRAAWLFGAFLVLVGATHFTIAAMFDTPMYRLAGAMKMLTAAAAWAAAVALIPAVPKMFESLERRAAARPPDPAPEAADDRLRDYIVAILAAVMAVLVRKLFDPLLDNDHAFVIPLLSVMFVAWRGGFGPAVVTLLLSMLAVVFLFVLPKDTRSMVSISDQIATGMFLLCGVVAAVLGEAQRTGRRRTEQTLADLRTSNEQLADSQRESASALARLNAFIDNAPVGIAFFDEKLTVVKANQPLLRNGEGETRAGLTPRELFRDFPEDALADIERAVASDTPLANRVVETGSAADPKVWQLSVFPIKHEYGFSLGLGVIAKDATEQHLAERRIMESERRFRTLTEAIPQLVWNADARGQATYLNTRWREYTGMADLPRDSFWWGQVTHADDVPEMQAAWGRVTRGEPEAFETEIRVRRAADGVYRWFQAAVVPMRRPDGSVDQWIGSLSDIDDQKREAERLELRVREQTAVLQLTNETLRAEVSERLQAEEQVRSVALDLRRSNEELEKFAYVASHDLQEPLRKIQAFGDRLATRFRDEVGDQGREYIGRMLASAARMRTLINDLLAFSRVGIKGQAFTHVDLGRELAEVLSDLEVRITETGADVTAGPLPAIEADPLQMRQLFQNLIANALKFRKPDVPPHIQVTATATDNLPADADPPPAVAGVRLVIADNGIGFEQTYAERIFEVFQRLHAKHEFEGTGIGLAVCRKIVERHGGEIAARGTPGEGAVFIIDLPLSQPKAVKKDLP